MAHSQLQLLPGDPALLQAFQNLVNHGRAAGHDHIVASGDGVRAVHHDVHIAPVGDNSSVKAPLLPKDMGA